MYLFYNFSGNDNMVVQDDTVFVSGMDPDVTESEINTHFGAIGIIKVRYIHHSILNNIANI